MPLPVRLFARTDRGICHQLFLLYAIIIEIISQALYNAFGKVLLLCFCIQGFFFTWIGNKAQFQQRCRHVRMEQDVEISRPYAPVLEIRRLHILIVNILGKAGVVGCLAVVISRYATGIG